MPIVVIEGSNGSGKSTLINYLKDKYDIIVSKSVPEWFRDYIPFARSLNPDEQKKVYEIGHIAAFKDAVKNEKLVIFDRYFYSTIIRLCFEERKTIESCIEEIARFPYKPDFTVYLSVSYDEIIRRLSTRENFGSVDYEFYCYEKEIYLKLSELYDNIVIVDNNRDASLNADIVYNETKSLYLKLNDKES